MDYLAVISVIFYLLSGLLASRQLFSTQKKLNYQITGRRDGDTPVLYASTDVAEQKLKWKAQRSLEEMISSSWQWEQNYRTD